MNWPEIGKPLPRLGDAYATDEKLSWILSEEGHGRQLQRVFGPLDAQAVWEAITAEIGLAPVTDIRDVGRFGVTAELQLQLTFNERTATVITAWQYDDPEAGPRLVTAYPTT